MMLRTFMLLASRLITGWPWPVLIGCLLLTVVMAPGIFLIEVETGQENLLPEDSEARVQNEAYQAQFGGDTMQLLLEGEREDILAADNLRVMQELEVELAADDRYLAVYSPATYLQVAADQAQGTLDQFNAEVAAAQQEAREQVAATGGTPEEQEAAAGAAAGPIIQRFLEENAEQAEQFEGITEFSIDNPDFVDAVLLDPVTGELRPQFQDLLPDEGHALVVARIGGNVSLDDVSDVAVDFEETTDRYEFRDVSTLSAGSPELVNEITTSMTDSLLYTGLLAALLMVVVLSLVFRAHWRLLSLPVMVIGVVWIFGLMGYLGIPLTIVTVAGLPIMIGLGVDFAIQFHNRYQERMAQDVTTPEALRASLLTIGPGVTLAMIVTAYGFVALFVSDVPVVRDFAIIHAVGVSLAFAAGLLVLNSVVFLRDRAKTPSQRRKHASAEASRIDGALGWVSRAAMEHPYALAAFALGFFLLGVYYDGDIGIETDPERYVSADSEVLEDLNEIREVVGSTGEIGIMVETEDAFDPAFLSWMADFEREQLEAHPRLLKAASSPASTIAQLNGGEIPQNRDVSEESFGALPAVIQRTQVSDDGRRANLLFVTANIPLEEVNDIVHQMRGEVDPPAGAEVSFGSLTVIGAETVTSLADSRRTMTFAALAGILILLSLLYWNPVKAALTMAPIALVIGWSSGVMYLTGIDFNPLTAVLGALVAGIGTEFTVLLRRQYDEEREAGLLPAEAMHEAVIKIGRAVTASAFTVMGGFGALCLSDFLLLRDFGIVTVISVFLALVATLVLLPAVTVLVDEKLLDRKSREPEVERI
ncbi:MAG TPA: hydrophobe/amphiphile efflux-3 (HAE3) family transporter [Dehalococcoidia bacterium]|nr:hydrophobe/amphiphile efflux-3 (HAE3) family transporter [Dehalococcoidia bacterium]